MGKLFSESFSRHLINNNCLFSDGLEPFKVGTAQSLINIKDWKAKVGIISDQRIHKRLLWDNYDPKCIDWSIVIPENLNLDGITWLSILEDVCNTIQQNREILCTLSSRKKFLIDSSGDSIYPFEDIWIPSIKIARNYLLKSISFSLNEYFTSKALHDIEMGLLKNLCTISSFTLFREFNLGRTFGENIISTIMNKNKDKDYYYEFIDKLCKDGLISFFYKYPVLAKLIGNQIINWINNNYNFINRFYKDSDSIYQNFLNNQKNIRVDRVKVDCSDPHRGGQSVSILEFSNNEKLVYKPRCVQLESAYQSFLKWCNTLNLHHPFKILNIISCDNYGWVEFIDYQPCDNESDLQDFYKNSGSLLAVLYLLGGYDCHYDNLIVSGNQLILVDAETLLHPEPKYESIPLAKQSEEELNQEIQNSVLRTGLLPRWQIVSKLNYIYDMSALGIKNSDTLSKKRGWVYVNTDAMHWGILDENSQEIYSNRPISNVNSCHLQSHVDDIVSGFSDMYRKLLQNSRSLLKLNGPLSIFSNKYSRFIFRSTYIYSTLQEHLLQPEVLGNGVEFSFKLESLSKSFLSKDKKPFYWSILAKEQHSLANNDIPYFLYKTDSKDLELSHEDKIYDFFRTDGLTETKKRIESLSEENLALQKKLIYGTFYSYYQENIVSNSLKETNKLKNYNIFSKDIALSIANEIVEEIINNSLQDASGHHHWIGFKNISNFHHLNMSLIDFSFYDGKSGLAFFLGALDHVRQQERYTSLISNIFYPLYLHMIQSNDDELFQLVRDSGIGVGSGIGGIIYSLTWLERWNIKFSYCSPIELAQLLVNLILKYYVKDNMATDIISGRAGCILSLLSLYDLTSEQYELDFAEHLGKQVIKFQDIESGGWKNDTILPLTGFSHGAAGIIYTLCKLYSYTYDKNFLFSAIKGLDYEDRTFNVKTKNWPDYRLVTESDSYMKSWCHGAPGIALSRLGSLNIDASLNNKLLEDAKIALETTYNTMLTLNDSLCCGNFGIAEILAVGGRMLTNEEYSLRAKEIVVERGISSQKSRQFLSQEKLIYNTSFFQGMSGIGYEYLRLAYPNDLPCVLLFC
jgi:type 2 lantibiotic biosynthesis protein LanM